MKQVKTKPRPNELIGGGFIVLARSKAGQLVANKQMHPFEHPSLEAAAREAGRLNESTSGNSFSVFVEIKSKG